MKRVLVALALVAAGAIAFVTWASRASSDGDAVPPSDPVHGAAPVAYAITYEISGADGSIATERLVVDRPFRSRYEAGEAIRITDAGWFAATSGDGWSRIEIPITVAGGDVYAHAVLGAARDDGLIDPVGNDNIAGRSCTRYRLGASLTAAFVPDAGAGGDVTEVCVDDDGLVLAERWTIDGEMMRDRVATEVRIGPPSEDEFTIVGSVTEVSVDHLGGATAPADPSVDPGFAEYWTVETPAGFDHIGRWAVVPPAVGVLPDPSAAGPPLVEVAMITDAWVDKGDLVVLDQGATVDGLAPPWDKLGYRQPVGLAGVGEATLVWDARMSEVRLRRPDGGFVRVAGTLPPMAVVAIAETLIDQSADVPAGVASGPDGPEG